MRHLALIAIALVLAPTGCRGNANRSVSSSKPATASAPAASPAPVADPHERDAIAALVGTKPPEWQTERWLNGAPQTLASLRGSVVLVRWWTAGCPYCSTSAPALRALHKDYAHRGLRVIGMYHHKEAAPFDARVYEETARKYELTFPLAFDAEWRTLESWLRDANGRAVSTGWTSITFLLDKRGVIRHVHPGGQYVAGDAAHTELVAAIDRLLAEPDD